jgi:hypothetical protein
MGITKFSVLAAPVLALFALGAVAPQSAHAQVSIGVNIGPEPVCPYGYYDYPPYSCAPYGYYGPEWFNGGVFIGAGPWFHGPANFHGNVNNHYDPKHGYHGPLPGHTRAAAPPPHAPAFHGNEARDGRGHVANGHPGR